MERLAWENWQISLLIIRDVFARSRRWVENKKISLTRRSTNLAGSSSLFESSPTL